MSTAEIVKEFIELVDTDKEYDLKELKEMLTDIYKTKNGKKPAKPRQPKQPKQQAAGADTESDDEKPIAKAKAAGKKKAAKADKMQVEKPKKPPTAYNMFIKQRVVAIKEEQPDVPPKMRLSVAAAEWKTLSQEQKDAYKP
jgi:hypothetical protein